MSFAANLSPSPVAAAFSGIEWDPLKKLRLSEPEKAILRAAEANPLDYTLADRAEAASYARVLLKLLSETAGPSGPSSRVSQVKETLSDAEALQILYADSMGVVTHYSIAKLHEIVLCLKEKSEASGVSIATTFYNRDGTLIDEWRPLLRVLHLGGSGDAFAQSKYSVDHLMMHEKVSFLTPCGVRRFCFDSRTHFDGRLRFSTKAKRGQCCFELFFCKRTAAGSCILDRLSAAVVIRDINKSRDSLVDDTHGMSGGTGHVSK
jgi:hypothetical protein